MWFSLFAVVLILTMTFFQGLQGLFSALIACVLTLLSAALAFGFYEEVYFALLMQYLPEQGRAVALVGIFVVALIVLRVVFDMLITGNMQFPVYVDRAGGGVVGFITSMIIVGMMAIGIQMLPFGPSFLGFSRYALVDDTGKTLEPTGNDREIHEFRSKLDWSKVSHRRRSLWLNPDGFTAGLVSSLSGNSLRGRQALASIYPDIPASVYNVRSAAFAAAHTMAPVDAISVEGYWDLPPGTFYKRQLIKDEGDKRTVELKPLKEMEPDRKAVVIRVRISSEAAEENRHRFSTRQIRLLGREGKDGPTTVSYVAGVNSEQFERWIQLHDGESVVRSGGKDGSLRIDLIFMVPSRGDYEPWFIEYKQNARAEVRPLDEKAKAKLGPARPIAPEKPKEEKKSPKPQEQSDNGAAKPSKAGRISGLGEAKQDSRFSDKLPFTLTTYGNLDVVNGKVRGGQTHATLSDSWEPPAGTQPPAESFDVPADLRLLQLSVTKQVPKSLFGRSIGMARNTTQNYMLKTEDGKDYAPVGMYAMAISGGKPTFELIYLDEDQRKQDRLPPFEHIKTDDMETNCAFFMLYALPPGTKPVEVRTGPRGNPVDLKGLNLEAPQ